MKSQKPHWLDPLIDRFCELADAHGGFESEVNPSPEKAPEPKPKPEPRPLTDADWNLLAQQYGLLPERRRPYKRFGKRRSR